MLDRRATDTGKAVLEVEDLVVTFTGRHRSPRGERREVVALAGIDLRVDAGKCLAVVGESGSGKSTLARAVVGLLPPTSGHIRFAGQDVSSATRRQLHELRQHVQMVFQDPYGSVNPRMTVRAVVGEALENYHRDWSRSERNDRVMDLLARVRLPTKMVDRQVSRLSGGQLQRVGIARALSLGPRLLVADEPVSALDASVQAAVLNLLKDLKTADGISFLFITHNLAVAEYFADQIAVIYAGRIVEFGDAAAIVRDPQHPYTKDLVAAIPGSREQTRVNATARDVTVRAGLLGPGCPYVTRCRAAVSTCSTVDPDLERTHDSRLVACHVVPTSERT